MTADGPQRVGVIVGGLHTLTFGIDPAQRFAVVQQELFGAALCRHLSFHKGSDLFVAVAVFKDTESSTILRENENTNKSVPEFIKRPSGALVIFKLVFAFSKNCYFQLG